MTIEEAQKAKIELERQILQLVDTFERGTKMLVERVELTHTHRLGDLRKTTLAVRAEVSL